VNSSGLASPRMEPARPKRVRRAICFLALLVSWSLPVSGQEGEPSGGEKFEGQKVSKVDVSAKASMDVEAFRSLIKQKAGEPFSMTAIRDSVAALQQTKLFSKVQVSIQPEQPGLNILFILQPALYVGMVSFPGAARTFPYTRLLQAVAIPEQVAYTDDLPSQGTQALLKFFRSNGYFTASVEAHIERDEAHRIVNIFFDCHLNRLAKIGQVNIAGASPDETADVRRALESFWATLKGASLKSGKKYSQQRITKSVDYIRAHLRSKGRLAPVVRFISPEYHAENNRADLNFEVNPGPMLSVRVTGARISKRTIKRLIPIYEENSADKDLVDEGRRNLLSYFQSKGYFDASVDSHLDQQANSVSVVYEVGRGLKHRVEDVVFKGNHHFEDKQLARLVLVKKGRVAFGHFFSRGEYSDDLLRKSVNALTAAYKDSGFADVVITPKVTDHEPRVDVTFEIAEGEQYKVNTLKMENSRTQPVQADTGKRPLNLQPGKPYSAHLLQEDRNSILARYLDLGALNAQFHSNVTPSANNPHLVDVVYTIDEGPRAQIGEVAVLGAKRTRRTFITKVAGPKISEGQPMSLGDFLKSESDLYNLGIFDWASVKSVAPISEQRREEVLVKVDELPRNSVDFGGGIEVIPRSGNIPVGTVALPGIPPIGIGTKFRGSQQSYWGPRVSFEFARHNLRGSAETAAFGLVYSRLDQRATFTYTIPRLGGSSWGSLFSLSAERSTQISIYTAEIGGASLQVQKSLDAKRTRHLIFRYSYQRTALTNITIPDLVLPQDQHVRLSTFAAEYVRDTRDKPLDAHHGVYQTFDFGVSPTALGSSANFVRFFTQTSFYRPIKPWLTWANNFRLGLAIPFAGSAVPQSERFFSGGADSLRGFPINGAGPQRPVSVCSNPDDPSTCSLISVPVGGDMLAIFNSELRFPIPLKQGLGGVLFYDGGNVYKNINLRQFGDDYTHTIGFGFRYKTPVGPIRFDVGRRLTSVPGVNATQYFVTLGQAF